MRILISSLGAGQKLNENINGPGQYRKTTYQIDDKLYEEEFIARALVSHFKIQKLFLIGTKKSIWDSVYLYFGGDDNNALEIYDKIEKNNLKQEDLYIIEKQIDKHLGTKGSKCIIISYGVNEEELWSNFYKFLSIGDFISNRDEIYLDITHSFRSLALMSFVMIEFLKLIREKQIEIKGIYYGMYEYRRENNNIAPVVDLKIFYELMQWIIAISDLKKYGNGNLISQLLNSTVDIKESNLEKISHIFSKFTSSVHIGDMNNIRHTIKYIKSKLNEIEKIQHPIASLMIPELKKFILRLDKDSISEFQFELAKWFREHEFYALSYIALVESVISRRCEKKNKDINDGSAREEQKKDLRLTLDNFQQMNRIRNDIAHLNYYHNSKESEFKIKKLNEFINWVQKEFFS